MPESCNVLISSAGRRVALLGLFRRSLALLGLDGLLVAADASRTAPAAHCADRSFQVPPCRHPDFVPAMLELCRAHEIGLVVPTIDTELDALARSRSDFEAVGATVAVSAPETIAIAADKRSTHRWLVAAGFPTVDQLELREARGRGGALDYPLIVKPVFGSASIGVHEVDDAAALAAVGGRDSSDMVVQTIAPGAEHTVDLYVDRSGRVRSAVPRRRLEVRAGEVSKSVTTAVPALEALVSELGRALPSAYGALNVQAFVSDGGEINIIEINPRFGGGYPLTWEAGAPFPVWLIQEALGMPLDEPAAWESDVYMLRYDDAVFVRGL